MLFGRVSMRMAMDVVAMAVRMRVNDRWLIRLERRRRDRPEKTNYIPYAQDDQHQPHGKLHGKPDARRNHQAEKNNGGAYQEDRQRVTHAPNCSNHRRAADIALAADDRTDGDDVIRVRGMTHPEKKSQRDDGKKANHMQNPRINGVGES